jgi:sigma-B regulation protein RsbU (phosphoserine phosphatase)
MVVQPRLLVVDDNEDNRYTLTQRLKRQGFTDVVTAEGGKEALDLLAAGSFDLVLLDVMMPEINGYEVLERLKVNPKLRNIPVIMISALDEIDSVVRCIKLGAEDYLPKPFNPVLLQARVGASLEKKRLRDAAALHLAQVQAELESARDIQLGMVPSVFPDATAAWPFEVFGALETAREIGGDLYDFYPIDEHTLGIVVADVCEKGAPAALFMAHTSSMLRVVTLMMAQRGPKPTPAAVMEQVNEEMCRVNTAGMFVTVFFAMADVRSATLTFCSAGHPMPYRVAADGTVSRLAGTSGIPVGIEAGIRYEDGSTPTEHQERLFLYTDGVTEAMNADGEFFGEGRLRGALAAFGGDSSRGMVETVFARVREFVAGAPQADDIAVMAVRIGLA